MVKPEEIIKKINTMYCLCILIILYKISIEKFISVVFLLDQLKKQNKMFWLLHSTCFFIALFFKVNLSFDIKITSNF